MKALRLCPALQIEKSKFRFWVFKDHLLQAQEQCILRKRKSGRSARLLAWVDKGDPGHTQAQKGSLQRWKQGQGTWLLYRDIVYVDNDGFEKLRVLVESNMARDIKANKKSFYGYLSIKEQPGKRWCLSGRKWRPGNQGYREGTQRLLPQISLVRVPATLPNHRRQRHWENEEPPIVGENQVRDHLRNLKVYKSIGSDEILLCVLRELAD